VTTKRDLIEKMASIVGVGPANDAAKIKEITEGRYSGPGYGWCGDAATWACARVGVTDGEALNRVEINGKWNPGMNLVYLQNWHHAHDAVIPKSSWQDGSPGDFIILFRSDGNHIGLIESINPLVTLDGNGWGGVVSRTKRDDEAKSRILEVLDTTKLLQAVKSGYKSPSLPNPISKRPDAIEPHSTETEVITLTGDMIWDIEINVKIKKFAKAV